ncbi:MAG: GAF domain-containing protein, partial [Burkholderiaceae bacterium]
MASKTKPKLKNSVTMAKRKKPAAAPRPPRARLRAGEVIAPEFTAARDLARAGKHNDAVVLTTAALAASTLSAAARAALLEARVESLIAMAEIRRADDDVAELLALAERDGSAALRVRALACLSLVKFRAEYGEAAIEAAAAALEGARRTRSKPLIALSLLRLANAEYFQWQRPEAAEHASRAAQIFELLGDRLQQGRALRIVAMVRIAVAITDESRALAQRAIDLARETGDHAGAAAGFNALRSGDPDLAQRLRGLKAALQANIDAGDQLAQANMLNNLSLVYGRLGMYRRARRMILRCSAIKGRALRPGALVNGTNILATLEMLMGHRVAAGKVLAEELRLYAADPVPVWKDVMDFCVAFYDILEGRFAEAISRLEQLHATLGLGHWSTPSLLGNLSRAYLSHGDRAAALRTSTAATAAQHAQHGAVGGGMQSDAIIWWQHHLALKANRKAAAAARALQQAYRLLVEGIATLTDEGLRRSYLHAPQQHAPLMHAWIDAARKQGLPRAAYTAHLSAPADLREPVERLVDTGLRLNALRAEGELHEFLIEEVAELVGAQRVLLVLEQPDARRLAGSVVSTGEHAQPLLDSIQPWLDEARSLRVTTLRHGPDGSEVIDQRSSVVAPLIAQQELIGYLYCDLNGAFGRFHDTDRDLLAMLASQAAVALANLRWAQGLEVKVTERTAELAASNARTEQRAAELSIINSIQQGIAGSLDFQGIVDLVGDKLRQILGTQDMSIWWYDADQHLVHCLYVIEHGQRLPKFAPSKMKQGGPAETIIATRQPVIQNVIDPNQVVVPGTDRPKSTATVPIIASDRVLGDLTLENHQREYAFGESEVRLLETIASTLGVALENARLFDETQRLLKETDQRAAELAVINSIQQGMAGSLDFQTIVDLVGDKLR